MTADRTVVCGTWLTAADALGMSRYAAGRRSTRWQPAMTPLPASRLSTPALA